MSHSLTFAAGLLIGLAASAAGSAALVLYGEKSIPPAFTSASLTVDEHQNVHFDRVVPVEFSGTWTAKIQEEGAVQPVPGCEATGNAPYEQGDKRATWPLFYGKPNCQLESGKQYRYWARWTPDTADLRTVHRKSNVFTVPPHATRATER